jgi:hypothetical protein
MTANASFSVATNEPIRYATPPSIYPAGSNVSLTTSLRQTHKQATTSHHTFDREGRGQGKGITFRLPLQKKPGNELSQTSRQTVGCEGRGQGPEKIQVVTTEENKEDPQT